MISKLDELRTYFALLELCLSDENHDEMHYLCNEKYFAMNRETIARYKRTMSPLADNLRLVTLAHITNWFAFNRSDYFYSIAIKDKLLNTNEYHYKITHIQPSQHRSHLSMWRISICKQLFASLTLLRSVDHQNLDEKK